MKRKVPGFLLCSIEMSIFHSRSPIKINIWLNWKIQLYVSIILYTIYIYIYITKLYCWNCSSFLYWDIAEIKWAVKLLYTTEDFHWFHLKTIWTVCGSQSKINLPHCYRGNLWNMKILQSFLYETLINQVFTREYA